jgi:hypothetical protein
VIPGFKTIDHLLNLKWRFYDIVGIVFTLEGIRVQLVDEDISGLYDIEGIVFAREGIRVQLVDEDINLCLCPLR